MTSQIIVQFVGFQSKPAVREYTFTVREPQTEPREFTLSIPNDAFNTRRVRYQDAPDVCSLKLRRELSTYANNPPGTHYGITDAELEDYRNSHAPRKALTPFARKPTEDF